MKIAVILAGCGRLDGSEIQESVLTLLSICQSGNSYQCFSIDANQAHVSNHLSGEKETGEKRNMLIESARIARGDIKPLDQLVIDEYAALVIPGGSGISYNLFDLAINPDNFTVNSQIVAICREFTRLGKPVGFICIAPAMIPVIYDFPVKMTIGDNKELTARLEKKGAIIINCKADDICIDERYNIISTPAYTIAKNIDQVYQGIRKLVEAINDLNNHQQKI